MKQSSAPLPDPYEVPAGGTVSGEATPPGSKSITQRYLNLALLGRQPVTIHRPLLSDDTRLYLAGLETCGIEVTHEAEAVRLEPGTPPEGGEIFCGAGGTMLRFLTAALTTVPGSWRLDGIPRLRQRPVAQLVDALRALGAVIEYPEREGFAPLQIEGGTLEGGETVLDAGASSQFLSALLMAALVAPRPSTIRVSALTSAPYVDLTLDAAIDFGGAVQRHAPDLFHVLPSPLTAREVTVESDYSSVAYPAAAAALAGGSIRIAPLRAGSHQGDRRFIDLLEEMGARVRWRDGSLEVAAGELCAVEVDMSRMPDQVPTLAALAPFAAGTTRIGNVAHLRIKESDRLSAMATELGRLGVPVEELGDALVVQGVWGSAAPPENRVTVDTHGDHRIAMSLALVGLRRPGVSIRRPEVVTKSYPDFWSHFARWIA